MELTFLIGKGISIGVTWPVMAKYAWAKASEGMTYQDPKFMANMSNGIDAGVIMGAYHFARPDNNLAIQDAENFLNTAGAYIGADFLLCT